MAYNKVIYGEDTLIDLTSDTVTTNNLLSGVVAHDKSGTRIEGTIPTLTLPTSTASSAASGYISKAIIERSTAAQYINIPSGYNTTDAYYVINAVANGSATAPSTISDTAASVSTGTNTLTLTKTVTVTPVVSAGYISAGTAGNTSVSLTAPVTTKAAATYTPTTTNQIIASDTYLTGAQTISGDTNLIASNIKKNISIFGIIGNFEGLLHLLDTVLIGEINTTSTTTTNTNKSAVVSNVSNYDLLVVESSIDTTGNNRHIATVNLIFLTAGNALNTKNGSTIATATWNVKTDNNGVITSRTSTTKYGLYANACNISDNTATIPIYRKYNSTQTGPLNGTYTTRVYGAKLYEMGIGN